MYVKTQISILKTYCNDFLSKIKSAGTNCVPSIVVTCGVSQVTVLTALLADCSTVARVEPYFSNTHSYTSAVGSSACTLSVI